MSAEPVLRVEGLCKQFGGHKHGRRPGSAVVAADDVNLEIAAGETLGLVGESGSGKSTLGRCIAGLMKPDAGRIIFDGRDLAALSRRQRRPIRGQIQVVFQDVGGSLNPRKTVGESISLPLLVAGRRHPAPAVAELLERVGLSASAAGRYPHEFSGGQRQRINIARAIALGPKLIICDEPASALDVSVQAQICNLLKDLQDDLGTAYLFVSHDLALVRDMADRIAVMQLGRIVESAPVDELFEAPAHPYTQTLIAATPGRRRQEVPGSSPNPDYRSLGNLQKEGRFA